MTDMNYEQKYKAALERARQVHTTNVDENKKSTEYIFPELVESKDERIKKTLIDYFKNYKTQEDIGIKTFFGIPTDDIISWLEKQGEQKPATIDIDKMVLDYANAKEKGNESFGKPVNCMIRAYRQGLTDALSELNLEKQGRQKPAAWSKEDEKVYQSIIDDTVQENQLDNEQINWLKSLKQRIGG